MSGVRYKHHATYGDQCAHCVEEEIREDVAEQIATLESALAAARDKALEEAIRHFRRLAVGLHPAGENHRHTMNAIYELEALRAKKEGA